MIKKARFIKAVLDNGKQILCTPNHKVLLASGKFKRVKDLIETDEVICADKNAYKVLQVINE